MILFPVRVMPYRSHVHELHTLDGLELLLERLLAEVRDGTSLSSSEESSSESAIVALLNRYCRSSTAEWS